MTHDLTTGKPLRDIWQFAVPVLFGLLLQQVYSLVDTAIVGHALGVMALGGVGATTSLPPALTLGCGAVGGSATSDNITPLNLMNIRRVAYGTKELSDLRGGHPAPDTAAPAASGSAAKLSASQIEAISQSLLQQLRG